LAKNSKGTISSNHPEDPDTPSGKMPDYLIVIIVIIGVLFMGGALFWIIKKRNLKKNIRLEETKNINITETHSILGNPNEN
jgi:phosphotransferase system  glucose/maltose/N-acetylglucosamine-specific IIC component